MGKKVLYTWCDFCIAFLTVVLPLLEKMLYCQLVFIIVVHLPGYRLLFSRIANGTDAVQMYNVCTSLFNR